MINTIDKILTEGGVFIGIVMDGTRVRNALDSVRVSENIPEDEASSISTPAFSITQVSSFSDVIMSQQKIAALEIQSRMEKSIEEAKKRINNQFDEEAKEKEEASRIEYETQKQKLIKKAQRMKKKRSSKEQNAIDEQLGRALISLKAKLDASDTMEMRRAEAIADEIYDVVSKYEIPPPPEVEDDHRVEKGKNAIALKINETETSLYNNDESGQTEWLFYFDLFVSRLKDIGIQLIESSFLDGSDKSEEFLVLPPASKAFSALNRKFIFQRVVRGQPEEGETQTETIRKRIKVKDVRMITGEDKPNPIVRRAKAIKKVKEYVAPLSFIEAVITATGEISLDEETLAAAVDETKQELISRLDKTIFRKLHNGEIYQAYKQKYGSDAFEKFKSRLNGQFNHRIGAEIVQNLFGVNINIVDSVGRPLPELCSGKFLPKEHNSSITLQELSKGSYRTVSL
jgi:hypothetical protein